MNKLLKWNCKNQKPGTEPGNELHVIFVLCSVFFVLVTACASSSVKLPPPPPRYVQPLEENIAHKSANSLWDDSVNIFEDTKAKRLNDLVMIRVVENLSGSGKADTDTSRESTADYGLTDLLGMNTDFNIHNLPLLNGFFKGTNIFEPSVAGDGASEFKGKGDTNREGSIAANITAKVVEVMPNGNLVLEARKELTINNEKQILVLTGMIRPDDIDVSNTVLSSKIADAQIYYVGEGIIQDKQSPGWLVRAMDTIWPF